MNRSKIEYCDHTFNIITGCKEECPYCYAKIGALRFSGNIRLHMMQKDKYIKQNGVYLIEEAFLDESGKQVMYPFGFEPTFHKYRADFLEKMKMGQTVFVGAIGDLFGDWVPDKWIEEVFSICKGHERHNYIFMTRNPKRYEEIELPESEHFFFGTTITKIEEMSKGEYLPIFRHSFIAFEPLLEDVHPEEYDELFRKVDWIIIGAETGYRKEKVVPRKEWILKILKQCDKHKKPVFMVSNIEEIIGKDSMRKEFPEELKRRVKSEKVKVRVMGRCMLCRKEFQKNEMATLSARIKRGGKSSSFAYMCMECFTRWLTDYDIKVPNLDSEDNKDEQKK